MEKPDPDSIEKPDSAMLREMRVKYREIRRLVYEEGTRPASGDAAEHKRNMDKLKARVVEICNNSALSRITPCEEGYQKLWDHLWTKNRYAGIKADIASKEIDDIKSIFGNYRQFATPDWEIMTIDRKFDYSASGKTAVSFFERQGIFEKKQTIRNINKIKIIVKIARLLAAFEKDNPHDPLSFVTSGFAPSDIWNIQDNLIKLGYRADLTALHCMMDLGFQVIKPDIVISRLFLSLGWLHCIMDSLPRDLQAADLRGQGKYGNKYLYTKSEIYRPIIDLARLIVNGIESSDLKQDIGWVTNNPLREFDIFLVKSGQFPEKSWGIERPIRIDGQIDQVNSCV